MVTAVPSSSGCAAGASGWTQPTGSSRSRKNGDSRPSGWIAEHTSCVKPGSVSSSERMPPPTVSAASWTVTSQPARAIVIAAASPFGPEPITTALFTPRAESAAPGPVPDRLAARARTGRRASRSAPGPRAPEVARPHLLAELLPAQRRRDRRPRLRPHRVGGGDRLAVAVLTMVDEHAATLLLEPFGRHEPRVAPPRGGATRSSASSYVSGYE